MYWLVNLTNGEADLFNTFEEAVEALDRKTADGFYVDEDFSIMDEEEYDDYINEETD